MDGGAGVGGMTHERAGAVECGGSGEGGRDGGYAGGGAGAVGCGSSGAVGGDGKWAEVNTGSIANVGGNGGNTIVKGWCGGMCVEGA